MRFEAPQTAPDSRPQRPSAEWSPVVETGTMHEEMTALEAQCKGLQTLVAELLLTNQKLRLEVARLLEEAEPTVPATHPRPRPVR
jgi:hypothetical protein